jgi:hypothetical protein
MTRQSLGRSRAQTFYNKKAERLEIKYLLLKRARCRGVYLATPHMHLVFLVFSINNIQKVPESSYG